MRAFTSKNLVFACLATTLLVCAALRLALAQQTKQLIIRPESGAYKGTQFYTNSHAIIVGINRYPHLPPTRQLRFAVNDAVALRDILIKYYGFLPGNITLLLDQNATKARIEKALSTLGNQSVVGKDDRVLLYFSGHGQTVKLPNGKERGFLIPYDANVDLDNDKELKGYLQTCLQMDNLWEYLDACAAKHRLLIADACYGGLLTTQTKGLGAVPSQAVIRKMLRLPAEQVITAGGSNEETLERDDWGHGAFTLELLKILQDQATNHRDQPFLASLLASHLSVDVGNITNGKQTPQFGNHGDAGGEFIFVPTAAHNVPAEPTHDPVPPPVHNPDNNVTPPPVVTPSPKVNAVAEGRQRLQAVIAAMGGDALMHLTTMTIQARGTGAAPSMTFTYAFPDKFRYAYGRSLTEGCDGHNHWRSEAGKVTSLPCDDSLASVQNPIVLLQKTMLRSYTVRAILKTPHGFSIKDDRGNVAHVFLNPNTGLIGRITIQTAGQQTIVCTYSRYTQRNGIFFPMSQTRTGGAGKAFQFEATSIQFDAPVSDSLFTQPMPSTYSPQMPSTGIPSAFPFEGHWIGTFQGVRQQGVVNLTIRRNGNVDGFVQNNTTRERYFVQGTINQYGKISYVYLSGGGRRLAAGTLTLRGGNSAAGEVGVYIKGRRVAGDQLNLTRQ